MYEAWFSTPLDYPFPLVTGSACLPTTIHENQTNSSDFIRQWRYHSRDELLRGVMNESQQSEIEDRRPPSFTRT